MSLITSKQHKSRTFGDLVTGDSVMYYILPLKFIDRIKNGTRYLVEAHPVKIDRIVQVGVYSTIKNIYFPSSFSVKCIQVVDTDTDFLSYVDGFNSELIMGCYIDDVPSKEEFVKMALNFHERYEFNK